MTLSVPNETYVHMKRQARGIQVQRVSWFAFCASNTDAGKRTRKTYHQRKIEPFANIAIGRNAPRSKTSEAKQMHTPVNRMVFGWHHAGLSCNENARTASCKRKCERKAYTFVSVSRREFHGVETSVRTPSWHEPSRA
jgi:hypothetical protein